MTGQQPAAELREMLQPPLAASGLDLEDVEVSIAGRRRLIRVLVDKDGGVTLDDVADATTVVSEQLDHNADLDDRPYTLEVTSPGVDRPLTTPRHWRRNADRLVKIRLASGDDIVGRIIEVTDTGATIAVDDTRRFVAYADVATARVEIEFNRPRSGKDPRTSQGPRTIEGPPAAEGE
ncbi:MAG: ribosome maturation factor RimP [Nocardioidaceae bacterium]